MSQPKPHVGPAWGPAARDLLSERCSGMIKSRPQPNGRPVRGVASPIPGRRIHAYGGGEAWRPAGPTAAQGLSRWLPRHIQCDRHPDQRNLRRCPHPRERPPFLGDLASPFSQEARWLARQLRLASEVIRAGCATGIRLSSSVNLRHFRRGAPSLGTPGATLAHPPLKVLERERLQALYAMGYRGGKALETERPNIDGRDGAQEFLMKPPAGSQRTIPAP